MAANRFTYTLPISATLKDAFGVDCSLSDTGGGCICLESDDLEGGVYLLVGAAAGGPLLTAEELDECRTEGIHADGYAVGVYGSEDTNSRAYAADHLATTPDAVVELAKRALGLARSERDQDTCPWWTRWADGTIVTERMPK